MATTTLPLAVSLSTTDTTVTILGTIQNASGSGTITIGTEQITYSGNSSNQFLICVRGANATSAAAHIAGVPVTLTETPVVTLPIAQPDVTPIASYPWTTITFGENVVEIQDFGVPTDAVTGKDIAPKGTRYTNRTSGTLYLNTGTQASPVWTLLQAGSDLGITQLTSDVTAGPGNGSQAATVASVGGKTASEIATSVTQAGAALPAASFTDSAVTGKLLTGYTSSAGTVASTDTILQGINKLNGNDALNLPLTGGTLTGPLGVEATPDASAILQADSITKGFLPPRMTSAQRNSIGTKATGNVTVVDYTALALATLTVAGHTLTEGVNWTAATSNDDTTTSLNTAINALSEVNSTVDGVITNQINIVGDMVQGSGTITLATSDAVNLTISGPTLTGEVDPAEGLKVYDTDLHKDCLFTTVWEAVTSTAI